MPAADQPTKPQDSTLVALQQRIAQLEQENDRLRGVEAELRLQINDEQAQLLQKLDQTSGVLNTLFDNAPLGIGLWDRQLRFVRINAALAEMNGLPPESHIGKTVAELLPDIEPGVMESFQRVVDTGESLIGMEASGETPAQPGQHRYWSVNYYPVYSGSQIVGVGAICEEITEKKRVEQHQSQLFRDQEELNHLKDQFLAVASHDLRTPLTSVQGYAQLMRRSLTQLIKRLPDSAEIGTFERNLQSVETILRQSERMGELINRLLEFSRIQSGHLTLNIVPKSNLINLIAQVVERQNLTNTHLIRLETSQLDLRADYDPARLEQVLDNLLGNATKYSPIGSDITVRVMQPMDSAQLVVSVQDHGFGISPEHQQRLFERFYRVQTDQTRYIDGMGLGLYISYEIITQHGGRLWVESQPSQGSTFYFSLPLKAHP